MARRLKQDIMEKTRALDIDRDCAQLGELSVRIHNHPGNQVVSTYSRVSCVMCHVS